jgi:C1A family cysteine protease
MNLNKGQTTNLILLIPFITVSLFGTLSAKTNLPSSFDWREKDIFTPVKSQGDCGSCGEFAAIALFEALIKKASGKNINLSEQEIVSCVQGCGCLTGCSSQRALEYMKENGVGLEKDFPYIEKDTTCRKMNDKRYFLDNVVSIVISKKSLNDRIEIIKNTIIEHGPVATNMRLFTDLDSYKSGIYSYNGKAEEMGGHWILIVGWHDDSNLPSGGYWICRNSWGANWGEQGYFNSAYGDKTGIDDFYIIYAKYNP